VHTVERILGVLGVPWEHGKENAFGSAGIPPEHGQDIRQDRRESGGPQHDARGAVRAR